MKIVDLLKVESIDLKAQPKDKAAALEHLITLMESGGIRTNTEPAYCVVKRRAALVSVRELPFRTPRQVL